MIEWDGGEPSMTWAVAIAVLRRWCRRVSDFALDGRPLLLPPQPITQGSPLSRQRVDRRLFTLIGFVVHRPLAMTVYTPVEKCFEGCGKQNLFDDQGEDKRLLFLVLS